MMERELLSGDSEIMGTPVILEKDFVEVIRNMKNGKAAGIDGVLAELMKHIIKNENIKTFLIKCFNNALREEVHEDWLESMTTMIPKTNKPRIMEHRPIAVTVNSSKIICTILREKVEVFLKEKGIKYENQYGFTEGGRIDHCLFILDYITNMTYEVRRASKKSSLYFAFIDFKKAYDSIDRKRLIEVLIRFKINPKVINLIVQMYEGDKTTIKLGKMKQTVEVTGGIRQGCSISTLLFKLVTFTMIEDLRSKADRYKIRKYENNSLWLADDATIIAKDEETLIKALEILEETGRKNGLELSEEKTRIMRIRGPGDGDRIGRFKVEKEAKYLGIQIGGKGRNIFHAENKIWLEKAEKRANIVLSQIRKSADRVIVGKAIWKMMAVPALMFGRTVVTSTKTSIEKLQRVENKVWRYLLGVGGYSTVEALRGEMGASMVKSRVMETMLGYMLDTLASDFGEVKQMMEDTLLKKKGRWYGAVDGYREELGITWKELRELKKPNLKVMIREYDTAKWYEGMSKKTSLRFYIQEKRDIKYDLCYRNSLDSTFYAKARINALKLEEQIGRGKENYNRNCKLCGKEDEDMVHFIIKCEKLEEGRNQDLLEAGVRDPEEKMRILLFRNERRQEVGKMIRTLWESRRKQLKEQGKSITVSNPQGVKVTTQGCRNKKKKEKLKRNKDNKLRATQGCKQTPMNIPLTTQGCRQSERIKNIYKNRKIQDRSM